MPTYGDEVAYLNRHTTVIELYHGRDRHGPRIAVCPDWQGRVMTSTCDGLSGRSFGWVNRPFIAEGKSSEVFNNYGGEDRFWLAPEGGQFALFFKPDAELVLANWYTPKALNEIQFEHRFERDELRMHGVMDLENHSGTKFRLDVARVVRLLNAARLAELLGNEARDLPRTSGLRVVGFETENTITNLGPPMTRETGLVSLWILGQFRPGPQTVIVLPYRAGDEAQRGRQVNPDYFGSIPPERLQTTGSAALFRGDGEYRSKIGISAQRVLPWAASIDLAGNVLTLVNFTLPPDPTTALYVNNSWDLPQQEPFVGDVLNSYNDGPPEPGAKTLGGFFELETLSPAEPLAQNASLRHVHRTFHLLGDAETLSRIARWAVGVDWEQARQFLSPQP